MSQYKSWVKDDNGSVWEATGDPKTREFYRDTVMQLYFNQMFGQHFKKLEEVTKYILVYDLYGDYNASGYSFDKELLGETSYDPCSKYGDCDEEKFYVPYCYDGELYAHKKDTMGIVWHATGFGDYIENCLIHSNSKLYVAFEDYNDLMVGWIDKDDASESSVIYAGNWKFISNYQGKMLKEGRDGNIYTGGYSYIYAFPPERIESGGYPDSSESDLLFADLDNCYADNGNYQISAAYDIVVANDYWAMRNSNGIYFFHHETGTTYDAYMEDMSRSFIFLYLDGSDNIIFGVREDDGTPIGIEKRDPSDYTLLAEIDLQNGDYSGFDLGKAHKDKYGVLHVGLFNDNLSPPQVKIVSFDDSLNVLSEVTWESSSFDLYYGVDAFLVVG